MWMMCPMETFVLINNLQLHCPIGVMEQEQVIGNDFCINLRIGYDFTRAMTSDDVGDTLNYAAVYQRTREVLARPVALIEKAAGNVAQALLGPRSSPSTSVSSSATRPWGLTATERVWKYI